MEVSIHEEVELLKHRFSNHSIEAHVHLQKLFIYRMAIVDNPGLCDPSVLPAALDFLDGRIAELDCELFGENEKAARPGDFVGDAIEASNQLLTKTIVPQYAPSDKAVLVNANG